jgi:hypothetical protein
VACTKSPNPFFLPLDIAPLARPLDPATGILADVCPAGLARDAGGGAAADARLAVEDDLGVGVGAREAEAVLELVGRYVEAVGRRRDGDVEGARDAARLG